ncbi:MAG: nitrogen regulation protein NR(II) [Gammaproteobacteria bacterium]|nr:nitrogen regulation protein NR(II) [Gammaproteobacteria bacterium]
MAIDHRRIVENLATAVVLADSDLRLTYVNPAAEVLLACSARHVQGSLLADLFRGSLEFAEALNRARRFGQSFTEYAMTLIPPPPAKAIRVDCTVTPIMDPDTPLSLLVEIQPLERLLQINKDEGVITQQTALRALLRGLAHEVKNPLGGLRGAAQLLERELPSTALQEYTQVIIQEADRLQNLVDHLLGPHQLPRRQALNLHEVLEHVRTLVKIEMPPGIVIERNYDPSLPDTYADRDQLVQAVLNIVRNACQALVDNGRIELRTRVYRQFTIAHRRHKLVARIDIADNGPGIAPELLEHIFIPMVSGRANGTGLGLSIAQSLINQNDGVIQCTSEPGNTLFSIYLPVAVEPTPDLVSRRNL